MTPLPNTTNHCKAAPFNVEGNSFTFGRQWCNHILYTTQQIQTKTHLGPLMLSHEMWEYVEGG